MMRMLQDKRMLRRVAFLLLVSMLAFAGLALAAGTAPQVSSLNGTVVAEGLVRAGSSVKEGQVLLKVKTLVGTAPAVRATANGTVVSVAVSPGDMISAGQVVAQLAF
ncbi:MAG: biotin/lipoyl-containing protein [Acidaminococcaceae bacterium]